MLIDFGPGSRELFTATVNQKVTYGLATIGPQLQGAYSFCGRIATLSGSFRSEVCRMN